MQQSRLYRNISGWEHLAPALDRPRWLDELGSDPVPPPPFIPALVILGEPRGGTGGGTLAFTIAVFFFSGGIAADPFPLPVPPVGPPAPLLLEDVAVVAAVLDAASRSRFSARRRGGVSELVNGRPTPPHHKHTGEFCVQVG